QTKSSGRDCREHFERDSQERGRPCSREYARPRNTRTWTSARQRNRATRIFRRMRAVLESAKQSMDNVFDELRSLLSRETIFRRNEPLAKRTTLRVGGPVDVYVEPATETELA